MDKGRTRRVMALVVLGVLLALAWWWLAFTPGGQDLMHRPHHVAKSARGWIEAHRIIAPVVVIVVYVALTVLALPVWWLQVMAGFAFGLWFGVLWCDLAATVGALAAFWLSRWLA